VLNAFTYSQEQNDGIRNCGYIKAKEVKFSCCCWPFCHLILVRSCGCLRQVAIMTEKIYIYEVVEVWLCFGRYCNLPFPIKRVSIQQNFLLNKAVFSNAKHAFSARL
jgi:hypothetical protein